MGLDADIYFYRTRSGMEVDLILKVAKGILGFEIKCREAVDFSDRGSLRSFARALGNEWIGGGVIYRGNRLFQMDDNIWAIPSYRLFS